jgi:hypothetical protein
LILRGIKTVEYRTRPTRIIGQRFWIYASGKKPALADGRWLVRSADNIIVPNERLPAWMIELAQQVGMIEPGAELPTGVIVGSAVIEHVVAPPADQAGGMFQWHLTGAERATTFRKPQRHPQPVWFEPF